ncbi:MAG TPA: 4-vinyl reductase [Kofleriaceae bacterium]|nr:4-vinyl reductase [Kofleriaceae bacterium]
MFSTRFDHVEHRRLIAGTEMIVNCEHYMSRLQSVVEGTPGVDGKAIFKQAAERAAAASLARLFGEHTPTAEKLSRIAAYYSSVGLGKLHLDQLASGVVEQSSSSFVKGWNASFPGEDRKICSYTEGFLQGAYHAVYGEAVDVREATCMHAGAHRCRFEIRRGRTAPVLPIRMLDQESYRRARKASPGGHARLTSETVDGAAITAGVLEHMPLIGDERGLCGVFIQDDGSAGAHLSSVPVDFFALLFADYHRQMTALGRAVEARVRLIGAVESCSYFTWGKVLGSREWRGMIAPMVKHTEDQLHGLVALANVLGRGAWAVVELRRGERLEMESYNNYEAESFARLDFEPGACSCSTMSGTATAYMNLVYPSHELNTAGIGDFKTTEVSCIARGDDRCRFVSERRALTDEELAAQRAPAGMSCAI